MVSNALLIAIVGVLGTILGAGITAISNIKRIQIQERERTKRKRAEFYLEKKVEAMTDFYELMIEVDSTLRTPLANEAMIVGKDDEELGIEEVGDSITKLKKLRQSRKKVKPYLDSGDGYSKVSLAILVMSATVIDRFPGPFDDSPEFRQQFKIGDIRKNFEDIDIDIETYEEFVDDGFRVMEEELAASIEDLEKYY